MPHPALLLVMRAGHVQVLLMGCGLLVLVIGLGAVTQYCHITIA